MKHCHQAMAILLALAGFACGQQPNRSNTGRPPLHVAKRMVMTWVAPYAVAESKARLHESFDGAGMKDGLTHLALQFFEPTKAGGLVRTRQGDDVGDAVVAAFRDWGHAHGIRVMLCVYNGGTTWDWSLAHAAFAAHPKEFTASLLDETERLGLDGVDVDLEGTGNLEADKTAFADFIRGLSSRLRATGRQLTVDSFPCTWNAPNQRWWKELLPLVDGLNSMGYQELGAAEKEWRAYAAQEAAGGAFAAKLLIGMPTDTGRWRGQKALDHLRWLRDHSKCGVALWDAQLQASAWRTSEAWVMLRQIHGSK